MDHFDRFFGTIERKQVDRPASWLGFPLPDAEPGLQRHFNVSSIDEVRKIIDDDLYPVEMPYHSPTSDAIYAAFDFRKKDLPIPDERTLTAPGFFEDYSDPGAVDEFAWPDPSKYIDPAECRQVVESAPDGYPVLAAVWSAHFQDVWAAFGMETALVKMITEPAVFNAVLERIVEFYLEANEIFYEAAKGRLHAVLIGNDFGGQTGLMLSADKIREFALPGTRRLVEQAHRFGLKVIHHSCGSVFPIIQDLIDCGVDAVHPIQALAKDMDAENLKNHFDGKISFVGGVDHQYLLVSGSPDEVRERVRELKKLFPTGLVFSPSHEAILPDINPANIEAMFDAVKE